MRRSIVKVEEVTELSKSKTPPRAPEDELRDRMIRYQAGDAVGVEELFQRLSPSLFGYFMSPQVSRSGCGGSAAGVLDAHSSFPPHLPGHRAITAVGLRNRAAYPVGWKSAATPAGSA